MNPPPIPACAAGENGPPRYSLRALFWLTTYGCVAAALAAAWGIGLFVGLVGLLAFWLNTRGHLTFLQTPRTRPRLYGLAWGLFGISFALPTLIVPGCGNAGPETWRGWQVAMAGAGGAWDVASETTDAVTRPSLWRETDWFRLAEDAIALTCFNLPNLLVLVSPWLLWRQQRGRGAWGHWAMSVAAFQSWSWGVIGDNTLRIGYYVWSSGVTLLALTLRPSKRSVIWLIVVSTIGWIVAIWRG